MSKKIKDLETIELEYGGSVQAWENNSDGKTVTNIYLVDKLNEIIKTVNLLSEAKK